MGRGQLLKTKVKAEKALTKAKLQAEKEWWRRKSNLSYRIEKELINTFRRINPLKLLAWGATTSVVYMALEASSEFISYIEDTQFEMPEIYRQFPELVKKWEAERTQESMFSQFFDILRPLTKRPVLFAISIMIGYIVIEHPEVFTEMFTSAGKLTTFALGLLK